MESYAKTIDRRRIKRDLRKNKNTIIVKDNNLIYNGWRTIPTKWGTHLIKTCVYVDPKVICLIDRVALSRLNFFFDHLCDKEIRHDEQGIRRSNFSGVVVYFKDTSSLSKFKLMS